MSAPLGQTRPFALWVYLKTDRTHPHTRPGRFATLDHAKRAARGELRDHESLIYAVEVRELLSDGAWRTRWRSNSSDGGIVTAAPFVGEGSGGCVLPRAMK